MRDVAELEEMSSWKSDKILPPIMLLACKQVELIACILQSVWGSQFKWKGRVWNMWTFKTIHLLRYSGLLRMCSLHCMR